MRINKYLAMCEIGSRRKVEELILSGRIKVNNKVVKVLSTDIKPSDIVKFDNKVITPNLKFIYYKLNKPKGYVTTSSDDKGRKTVLDLMRGVHTRVFPIGRLDYDTEGLLLLTNDGEISNILTSPKSKVTKIYMVEIEGQISEEEIKALTKGVDIGDFTTLPCQVEIISEDNKSTKLKIGITEGKNRQIRKMMDRINKNVTFLKRIQIGEIRLGGLSRGEYKALNPKEIKFLNSLKNKN